MKYKWNKQTNKQITNKKHIYVTLSHCYVSETRGMKHHLLFSIPFLKALFSTIKSINMVWTASLITMDTFMDCKHRHSPPWYPSQQTAPASCLPSAESLSYRCSHTLAWASCPRHAPPAWTSSHIQFQCTQHPGQQKTNKRS